MDSDVLVIGGGPAGCSTAINLARAGLRVTLLEKGQRYRHKACGGVLPSVAPEIIEDIIGAEIPTSVFEQPRELGLFYVPPSGRRNGGKVQNYVIHNIDRDSLDQWLRDTAEEAGVHVHYGTRFHCVEQTDCYRVQATRGSDTEEFCADYLVGADGVRSQVRDSICTSVESPVMIVAQQGVDGSGDFEECFYGFFRGDVSIAYAYVIPKNDHILLGLGAESHKGASSVQLLGQFKEWLEQDFSFRERRVKRREMWAIPFGYFHSGRGRALLVGDAAGLCNPLSGEGIRYAIESGEAAAQAIASDKPQDTVALYSRRLNGLVSMVMDLNEFVRNADDTEREEFIRVELKRAY